MSEEKDKVEEEFKHEPHVEIPLTELLKHSLQIDKNLQDEQDAEERAEVMERFGLVEPGGKKKSTPAVPVPPVAPTSNPFAT